jgi:hypothetical protein
MKRRKNTPACTIPILKKMKEEGCQVVIPFSDSYAPTVPVLHQCGGEPEGILLLERGDGWGRPAGTFITA